MTVIFQNYVHHLDLHTFPTRRSSDLGLKKDKLKHHLILLPWMPPLFTIRVNSGICGRKKHRISPGTPINTTVYRSEEHTSELQSRFDLVCRLLLEKKNLLNCVLCCNE